jgi:4-hydroxy-tetrahydrodipicolinate reductase
VDNFSTSIVVFGSGRMGSRIVALGVSDRAFDVRACVTHDRSPRLGAIIAGGATSTGASTGASANAGATDKLIILENTQKAAKNAGSADVVIDFSSEAGLPDSIALAARLNAALLVGTTGLSPASIDALKSAARDRAVLLAPNTSLGVAALSVLVEHASKILGSGYHCSIVEAHHAAKKDAPSGTALRLAQAVRKAGHALADDQILAMRGGDVIGEHTVRFAGPGEYIELTHRATSRDLFARGALRAAAWLKGKSAGWYSMHDVLGLPG